MILVQYYAFVKYFNVADQDLDKRSRSLNEKYQLPDVSVHLDVQFMNGMGQYIIYAEYL